MKWKVSYTPVEILLCLLYTWTFKLGQAVSSAALAHYGQYSTNLVCTGIPTSAPGLSFLCILSHPHPQICSTGRFILLTKQKCLHWWHQFLRATLNPTQNFYCADLGKLLFLSLIHLPHICYTETWLKYLGSREKSKTKKAIYVF